MSRIFITGDTHADYDWKKLTTKCFPEQKELTKDDYVIIAGDFGGVFLLDRTDKYIQKNYNERNFTTLFVDGNHENHDALDAYPVEEWHGGKIHRIADSVLHLMRGQVFEIGGKTFFTMGGAESTDRQYRKEGKTWWAREMPSIEEYEEAITNLEKCGGKVDYVITHCAPEATLCALNMPDMYFRSANELTSFFDTIAQTIQFKDWYFGHYHDDSDFGKFHLLYRRIVEVSTYIQCQ